MAQTFKNPFLRFAKSNDLTDEEIQRLWVNFDGDDSGISFFDPSSPMATIVLGGKGSGKTHLFRYFSFPVQGRRYKEGEHLASLLKDRYVGIYTLAGGLNGSRFNGKGIAEQQWVDVFCYYLELWFGQTLLKIIGDLATSTMEVRRAAPDILKKMTGCFDQGVTQAQSFEHLGGQLRQLQRDLDIAVNDAAFSNSITPTICCTRGSVTFGFPEAIASSVSQFSDLTFCYYVDEYENFLEYQQRYVNTLVRERRDPVTFRIGSRAYGLHTLKTYSGGDEEICQGSEFEYLQLDSQFRKDEPRYQRFAKKMLRRRIDIVELEGEEQTAIRKWTEGVSSQAGESVAQPPPRPAGSEYEHIRKLRRQLAEILGKQDVESVISCVSNRSRPLLEKAAILRLYQAASRDKSSLVTEAKAIRKMATNIGEQPIEENKLKQTLSHYRDDLEAQLLRDSRVGSRRKNHGINELIRMSEGLPRALLTMVGNIVRWAVYRGDLKSGNGEISAEAVRQGLLDSGEWFLSDVPEVGVDGESIRTAVGRLGELFRINRFADKPSECSMIGFSVDLDSLSTTAKRNIEDADKRSFLIEAPSGQKDKSSKKIWTKYHLNRVLCPMFDLPIGKRGHARLDGNFVSAIFDSSKETEFRRMAGKWDQRLNWPFAKDQKGEGLSNSDPQLEMLDGDP